MLDESDAPVKVPNRPAVPKAKMSIQTSSSFAVESNSAFDNFKIIKNLPKINDGAVGKGASSSRKQSKKKMECKCLSTYF